MAINFAGGSDQVRLPITAGATFECLSFFMRTTQTTGHAGVMGRHEASLSADGWVVDINDVAGKITTSAKSGTSQVMRIDSSTSVVTGSWLHVGIILCRTTTSNANKIYVNGSLDVQGTASSSWGTSTQDIAIGKTLDTFWPSYVGDLAEFAYWGIDLDAAEIAALAKGFRPSSIRPASLKAYIPGIRTIQEIRGTSLTVTGTSVADHPRVF